MPWWRIMILFYKFVIWQQKYILPIAKEKENIENIFNKQMAEIEEKFNIEKAKILLKAKAKKLAKEKNN